MHGAVKRRIRLTGLYDGAPKRTTVGGVVMAESVFDAQHAERGANPGEPMLDESQQQSLVTRLNRIEGQVRGIRRMVQEPRLCVDILQQLAAAEAALNRISLAVLKYHVERCVPEGIVKGEPEKTRRLNELVDIFDRFAK